jgi:hypothetical protein
MPSAARSEDVSFDVVEELQHASAKDDSYAVWESAIVVMSEYGTVGKVSRSDVIKKKHQYSRNMTDTHLAQLWAESPILWCCQRKKVAT